MFTSLWLGVIIPIFSFFPYILHAIYLTPLSLDIFPKLYYSIEELNCNLTGIKEDGRPEIC